MRVPFIPFGRRRFPRLLPANVFDMASEIMRFAGLEMLHGAKVAPRAHVLATIMSAALGWTATFVRTVGLLPEHGLDKIWEDELKKRLMRFWVGPDAHLEPGAELYNGSIMVTHARSFQRAATR